MERHALHRRRGGLLQPDAAGFRNGHCGAERRSRAGDYQHRADAARHLRHSLRSGSVCPGEQRSECRTRRNPDRDDSFHAFGRGTRKRRSDDHHERNLACFGNDSDRRDRPVTPSGTPGKIVVGMRHVIVGTAGHIDHGKTSLVRALTGIDTDRLEEEKRRGISIDLGFAHLDLSPDLRVGFVDVPGHERFVRNMLAGASGIDLALLVIAADESIKPQTREHFEICRLLEIRGGVIALTKADLVESDLLDLARLEAEEFVAGSFLEKAEIVPVSAATGAGLDRLRAALDRAARLAPVKDSSRHARLPIDRSFSMRGHGAVVTGTLTSGCLGLQDELELYPAGRRVRVRGLQVHGSPVERAFAGERTAVNLSGVDSSEVRRGMTLAPPGLFRATTQIDCSLELLASAHPLKHRAPVHFHAGTAEVEAEARLIDSLDPVRPGSTAHVRFRLRDPLLLLPGDRFIIRMFSPVVTIGGGVVLDIAAPARIRRGDLAARLAKLEQATPAGRIALLVAE